MSEETTLYAQRTFKCGEKQIVMYYEMDAVLWEPYLDKLPKIELEKEPGE